MNHSAIIEAESVRLYQNRSYILSDLDERHFDALNADGHVIALNGYCLDALDDTPRGSMSTCAGRPAMDFNSRGMSWAEHQERESLAERLVAEILAEERAAAQSGTPQCADDQTHE